MTGARLGLGLGLGLAIAACGGEKKSGPVAQGSDKAVGSDKVGKPTPPGKPIDTLYTERWAATFVVGADLRDMPVTFVQRDKKWAGLIEANKKQLALTDVVVTPDHIAFTIEKPKPAPKETWEHYELTRKPDSNEASGTGTIGGATIAVRMVKLAAGESMKSAYPRSQEPKGPYPYEQREVTIDGDGGAKLVGTLTVPKGDGPFPAVLLLSGSGQQDRDETIFGHKPYLILADALTRAGFVTYRFDDRATGKTVGKLGTLDTEIADAGLVVEALAKMKEIDPKRIGVVGHSTGGMVAPNVALSHPVAFVISLAGPAVSGRELVPLQLEVAAKAKGLPEAQYKDALEIQRQIGDAVVVSEAKAREVLTAAVKKQIKAAAGRDATQEEIDKTIAAPLAEATQPWTVSFFKLDPRDAWKKLKLPVLLVIGDKDTQVPAEVTIKNLKAAATGCQLTVIEQPELNHLFQHARTGMPDEYLDIEESFDPATVKKIVEWATGSGTPRTP